MGRPLLVRDYFSLFSLSATMWSVCATKASMASAIMAFILHGWSSFTLLNPIKVLFFFFKCTKKALLQIWAIKWFLLGLVCLWPIKANNTGQAAQAVCALGVFLKRTLAGDCFPSKKAAIVESWGRCFGLVALLRSQTDYEKIEFLENKAWNTGMYVLATRGKKLLY